MIFYTIILVIIAYLIGSIPTSVWISRLFYKMDLRDYGSGNAGATNTIRILGWKAGVPVLLFDVFKGWFAVYLIHFSFFDISATGELVWIKIALAAAAVLGHIFPVYIGFKGGKGVSTLLGVGIALYPVAVWIVVAVFVLVLLLTGIVSISSIIASISFPLIIILFNYSDHLPLIILSVAVGVFIPLTHMKNIRRLIRGEEKSFIWRKR